MSQLDIICCPDCKETLSSLNETAAGEAWSGGLFCPGCKRTYLETDGYLDFLGEAELVHSSKREKFIRSVYAKIYTPATNFMFLFCGGVRNARDEVLSRLEISDHDVVLETGMGAGENLLRINGMANNITFYAIDIQKQMMKHCMKNLKKWNIEAALYRADAEDLPFRDEKFDVVFHLGAINLFPDKKKAIEEMIRVAKPGTRMVVADETEKAGRLFNIFTGSDEKIVPPMDLIPDSMKYKKIETIWGGYGYVISFFKPSS